MSYLTNERETITLNLPSDNNYWVKFYKSLDYGETKKLAEMDNVSGNATVAGDTIFKSMICEWNLDDEQGNILPITNESIDRMKAVDASAIMNAISEVMSTDEKKDLPNQS